MRAIIIVLDSVGVGASLDAQEYGDVGANTLGNISNKYSLKLPNLEGLGIANILEMASGSSFNLKKKSSPNSYYGFAKEVSKGKDSVTGHWEIAGAPVLKPFMYFKDLENSFPLDLLEDIVKSSGINGYLGNCHASGTEIIEKLGLEHIKTKKPIFYTSFDSVFQIAASEEVFGLENLYKLCEIVREKLIKYNVGRVIARPFVGSSKETYKRTANRKDYALEPEAQTMLDIAKNGGVEVVSIGKIKDLFNGRGITRALKRPYNEGGVEDVLEVLTESQEKALIFANLNDFDSSYGHRRDYIGYAKALEYFDTRLPEILAGLKKDDLLIITADHGCDPTFKGSDHTREYIPVIAYKNGLTSKNIGKLETFSDIAASVLTYLDLPLTKIGKNFL